MRSIMPPQGTTRIRHRFLWWPLTIKYETRWLEFAWVKERVWFGVTVFGEYVWQPCAFVDGPEEVQPPDFWNTGLIGTRVMFKSLLHEGDFLGEIIAILAQDYKGRPICRVKLQCQEKPVGGVLYFDSEPVEVDSTLWQICYPIPELLESLATLERYSAAAAMTVTQDVAMKEDREIMGVRKQDVSNST